MRSWTGHARTFLPYSSLIVRHVKSPKQAEKTHEPFSMLATTLGADPFIGRILTGRVETGRLKAGRFGEGSVAGWQQD